MTRRSLFALKIVGDIAGRHQIAELVFAAHMQDYQRAALVFGNSPKAMAVWGCKAARLGANPIAFACPAPAGDPLVIDLALSQAARGRIVAEAAGEPIPLGWAVDADGHPTTDASAALKGALLPIGGAKDRRWR